MSMHFRYTQQPPRRTLRSNLFGHRRRLIRKLRTRTHIRADTTTRSIRSELIRLVETSLLKALGGELRREITLLRTVYRLTRR